MSSEYIELFVRFPTEEEHIKSVENLKNKSSSGFNINEQDANGDTNVHVYVKDNFYPSVRIFCEAGADVNIKDNKGVSPLETAVRNRCEPHVCKPLILCWKCEIISILKKYGAIG